jgi:(S)-ureidoglycine aminohydrolase
MIKLEKASGLICIAINSRFKPWALQKAQTLPLSKKILPVIFFLVPVLTMAQQDSVLSKMYSWARPQQKDNKNIFSAVLLEGKTLDMEYLQFNANTLVPATNKTKLQVPGNEEQLVIVRAGTLTITMKDSSWSIGPGSVAILMPGEKYSLQNTGKDPCDYYMMRYRSALPADKTRGKDSGGSLVRDWNNIPFKPHDKGGIRNYFERATAMCKRLEMHVTTLNEGLKSHDPHTHRAAEMVLVISGKTEMQIADKFYKGGAGDVYYLGSNVSHAIRNDGMGPCIYFAFQFE